MMTKIAGISSFRLSIDHTLVLSRTIFFRPHVAWSDDYCSLPPALPLYSQHSVFVPSDGFASLDDSPLSLLQSGRSGLFFSSFSLASPGNHTVQVHSATGEVLCSHTLRSHLLSQ